MFRLLHGRFPEQEDLDDLNDNNWVKDGLSQGEILISAKDTCNYKSYKIEQSNTNGSVCNVVIFRSFSLRLLIKESECEI